MTRTPEIRGLIAKRSSVTGGGPAARNSINMLTYLCVSKHDFYQVTQSDRQQQENRGAAGVRIDRWLWATRFFKTRQLAAGAVKGGKVSLNGDRPKPAKLVHIGDSVVVTRDSFRFELVVLKLGEKRVSAPLAQAMYEESTQSIAAREQRAAEIKANNQFTIRTEGRPTKRDRRLIDRFHRGE